VTDARRVLALHPGAHHASPAASELAECAQVVVKVVLEREGQQLVIVIEEVLRALPDVPKLRRRRPAEI
jgi:hypothetical protein